jgi:hypothetical protein
MPPSPGKTASGRFDQADGAPVSQLPQHQLLVITQDRIGNNLGKLGNGQ